MNNSTLVRRLASTLFAAVALSMSTLSLADSWRYDGKVDAMTSKETKLAFLHSDNSLKLPFPYNDPNNTGSIMVRSTGKSTDVMVSVTKGQILCPGYGDGCTVTVRFDQAPPIRFAAIGPNDHSSTEFFIHDAKRFVSLASKASKILIQFTMYSAGNQTLEFSPPTPLVWGAAPKKK